MGPSKNPDVDRLVEDVNRLNKRWGNCCMQGKGSFKYYVSKEGGWVGHAKCLLLLTRWVGGL